MADILAPHFQDADKAREYLEALRWPNGPVCPHCGTKGAHYALNGASHRPGLWKCKDCRKQFSVTVGTVFERSKIPMNKWLLAVHLMCASKKAISSHQTHRMLGVTYKSAWFMAHRIREAMTSEAACSDSVAAPLRRTRPIGAAPASSGRARVATPQDEGRLAC
jgi:transposase-like protein